MTNGGRAYALPPFSFGPSSASRPATTAPPPPSQRPDQPPFLPPHSQRPDLLFYTVPFRCPGRAHACRLPPMPRPTNISSTYPVSRPTASYNRPTGLFRAGRAAKNETDHNRVATPNLPIALKCMPSWIQAIVSIAPQFSYPPSHTVCTRNFDGSTIRNQCCPNKCS